MLLCCIAALFVSSYGFTDTVAKTGSLLFSSLLFLDAARQLARLAAAHSCGDAARYTAEANLIAAHVDAELFNGGSGGVSTDGSGGDVSGGDDDLPEAVVPLWLAASVDNRLPDVWGSAYLAALNLSTAARRGAAMGELTARPARYFLAGQVRHLPLPLTWERCCWTEGCIGGCVANGTYQNGAFWATALSYIVPALAAEGHGAFATELLRDAVADFKAHGVYEDVDRGLPAVSNGVLNYTASATNALLAARVLARKMRKV